MLAYLRTHPTLTDALRQLPHHVERLWGPAARQSLRLAVWDDPEDGTPELVVLISPAFQTPAQNALLLEQLFDWQIAYDDATGLSTDYAVVFADDAVGSGDHASV